VPTPPLPTLHVSPAPPRSLDVLVVGLAESGLRGLPDGVDKDFRKRYGTGVAEMADSLGAKHAAGSRRTLPAADGGPRLMVIGLGDGEPDTEDLRRAAGSAARDAASLAKEGRSLSVAIGFGTTTVEELEAVAEGALLGGYRYIPISSTPDQAPRPVASVTVLHAGSTRAADGAEVSAVAPTVAAAVLTAREWVNVPPNLLYPES
jgi:leucyl aminopeptidase